MLLPVLLSVLRVLRVLLPVLHVLPLGRPARLVGLVRAIKCDTVGARRFGSACQRGSQPRVG